MNTIEQRSQREAVTEILARLGHEFEGDLSAQLDRRLIDIAESEDDCGTVYTHPLLPDTRVLVGWEYEA